MGKGGDRGYPSHNKGFTEHTPDHVRKAHYEQQASHFQRKAREVSEPPEQHKGRGRSADSHRSGRSHKSAHNMQNKNQRKNDDNKFPDCSMSNFGMLPLPSLYPEALEAIADSYNDYYDMSQAMKGLTVYSYEAYTQDRSPYSFYVSADRGPNKEKTFENYVAYVTSKDYLNMDHQQLKSIFQTQKNTAAVMGGIYYSKVITYKLDGEDKEGFVSFLFPMAVVEGDECSDSKFVAWVQAGKSGPPLAPDQMPKTVSAFYHFFKESIIATNIKMKGSQEVEISEPELERLVKSLRTIYSEKTRLMRTQGAYSISDGVRANVYMRRIMKKTKENDPEKGHRFQMIVPYTSGKAGIAKKIIRIVMNKCLKKVTEESYLKSMDFQDNLIKHTSEGTIGDLWLTSVWILSTEMCRCLMTSDRIKTLTETIFHDHSDVYEAFGAWANITSWNAIKKKNGIKLKTKELLRHFAGSNASAYRSAIPSTVGAGRQGGGGAAAIGPPQVGGNDVNMDGKGTRIWDDSR